MQITFTAHAWVDTKYNSLEEVLKGKRPPSVSALGPNEGSHYEDSGAAYLGPVTCTVNVNSRDEMVNQQIKALNKNLQKVRAEAQQRENAILLQISKLQALTLDPNTVEA